MTELSIEKETNLMEPGQNIDIRAHLNPLGNWCNHIPYDPKLYSPPEQHGTRPDVLLQAQNSLEQFYWHSKEYLTNIFLTRISGRQQRTEAREAVCAVLGVILHYLDLATMRVGIPNADGTFHSLSAKDIAVRLGWRTKEDDNNPKTKDRGIKRAWRAMAILKAAGYLSITQRCEKLFNEEQEYRGLPAIRCVMKTLFRDLKVSLHKLEIRRKQSSNRLKKRYREFLNKLEAELKVKGQKGVQAVLELVKFNKNLKQGRRAGYARNTREKEALAKMEAKLKAEGSVPDTG
ncbi:MAG: hypothetical protein KAT71_01635 [Gammaproteobacteria bacterium]|nr:hypothetical protein [Gammaproteobacteria bacterium]